MGLQIAQPEVPEHIYGTFGPPPVAIQCCRPYPGRDVVHKPGPHEIPKGILAGLYVKPVVHIIQYLGQPALSLFSCPFNCDPLLVTPTVRVLPNIYDDGPGALGPFQDRPSHEYPSGECYVNHYPC